jgi:hypothetical protein
MMRVFADRVRTKTGFYVLDLFIIFIFTTAMSLGLMDSIKRNNVQREELKLWLLNCKNAGNFVVNNQDSKICITRDQKITSVFDLEHQVQLK